MEDHFGDSKDELFSDKASEFTRSFTPEHRQHRAFKAANQNFYIETLFIFGMSSKR